MTWKQKKAALDEDHACILAAQLVKCSNSQCSSPWWHFQCAGMSGISKNMMRNLNWTCSLCVLNSFEDEVDVSDPALPNSTVNSDQLKTEIVHELKQCLHQILNNPDNANHGTSTPVSNKILTKHTLLLKPNELAESCFNADSWATVVKHKLPEQLKEVPIKKASLTNSGMGYLIFPDKQSRDHAETCLKNDYHVKSADKSKKHVYPKIKISGIEKSMYKRGDEAELKTAILQKKCHP